MTSEVTDYVSDFVTAPEALRRNPDPLDERVAAALGVDYNPHWHRFTSEDEACEWLVEWLREHDVTIGLDGSTVTVRHRRKRLFAQAGDTPRLALAKAVVRLARDHPWVMPSG